MNQICGCGLKICVFEFCNLLSADVLADALFFDRFFIGETGRAAPPSAGKLSGKSAIFCARSVSMSSLHLLLKLSSPLLCAPISKSVRMARPFATPLDTSED